MAYQLKYKTKEKPQHIIQVQLWDTLVEFKWTKVNNRPSCVLWYSIRCRSIYHVPWGTRQFHSSLTKGVQTAVSLSASGDKCVRSPRLDTNTPDWNCPLLAGVCKIPSISGSFLGWWSCSLWDGLQLKLSTLRKNTFTQSHQIGFCGLQGLAELLFREHEQRRPNGTPSRVQKSIPATTFRSNLSLASTSIQCPSLPT